jgi:hypothetical protein
MHDQGVQGNASHAFLTFDLCAARHARAPCSGLVKSHPVSKVRRSAANPKTSAHVVIKLCGLQHNSHTTWRCTDGKCFFKAEVWPSDKLWPRAVSFEIWSSEKSPQLDMSVSELSETLDALALDMLALEVLVSELVSPESLAEELLMEQLPTSDMLALEVVPCMGKTCTKPRSEIAVNVSAGALA